ASLALGFSLAALAVVAAVAAFWGIWLDGRRGLGPAVRGLVVGLAVLVLPAIGAWKVVTYPRLIDVSTDLISPPDMTHAAADRGPFDAAIVPPTAEDAALQKDAYPDIVP